MAQLNDTMVQGDLRVTGKIYGTENAIRVEDANLAIPPLGVGDYVGSTGDFFIDSGSGKNLPNNVNNFNIHTTVTHYNETTYRLSQIATPTSASNPTGIYERGASSSDGVTWTFGSWLAAASSSHTHGNIANGGTLQTNDITIANGDKLVVTDSSDSGKVARASIAFDGSTTTQALTKAGTWATFNNYSHPAGSAPSKTGVPTDNATPGFGGTFKVNQITTDSTSHVSAVTERTITIPNATATTSADGLMSAADKTKLDGIAAGTASPLMDGKASVGNSLKYAREDHVHPSDTSREDIANKTTVVLGTSDSKYPTDKAVAEFVNSSIATNTANYISNNGEPFTSVEQLEAYSGTVTNNDYAFVTGTDSDGNTYYDRYKATVSGSTVTWALEYRLNNSSFTAAQWSAINSGITSVLVAKIHDHSNKDVLDEITSSDVANWNSKQNSLTAGDNITIDGNTISSDQIFVATYGVTKYAEVKAAYNAGKICTVFTNNRCYYLMLIDTDQIMFASPAPNPNIFSLILTSGSYWSKYSTWLQTHLTFDTAPKAGSKNPVTSYGIKTALDEKLDIDDVTSLSLTATYTEDNHRLTFNDIIFDNIYPVVGKYGLAVFKTDTTTAAIESSGDKDWLLDWRPYLVDMNAVAGETAKKPIAELRKANWLRNIDGSFAPVCGITAAQSTCLDGKSASLKWGKADDYGASSDVATDVPEAFDGTEFNPAAFWNYVNSAAGLDRANEVTGAGYRCAIEVEVTDGVTTYKYGAYGNDHIPAPWETTRTDLSVFIGRTTDVYVIDGAEKYGDYMRGLCAKPVPVGTSQFDPEFFKLRRTGISPGPSTTKGGKIRNFFYNYVGTDSNTAGDGNAACFKNNGTYPRTTDASQYTTANWSRACNSGGSSGNAVPVAEGGYFALNAFLCSLEAAYKDRNLWSTARFSTGISSNDTVQNGIWNGSAATEYTAWTNRTVGSDNANGYRPKFQCMEPQIAASLAAEMGLAANTAFTWNGGEWHYEVPELAGINSLTGSSSSMNCRIYKKITEGLSSAVTSGGHYMLRCALAEGVNPTGDILWYQGGGCELVYMTTGTTNTAYTYSFYLEPDQSKWLATSTDDKHTDGTPFPAETAYTAIITDSTAGGLGNSWSNSRTGYTPLRLTAGGNYTRGECMYNYRQMDDNAQGSSGIRSRRRLMFRGTARDDNCSPRYIVTSHRPSSAYANVGCAAQVLLA